jgi:hypothetical protein
MLTLSMMHLLLILEWLLRFPRFLMGNMPYFFLLGILLGRSYCGICSGGCLLRLLVLAGLALLLVLFVVLAGIRGSNILVSSLFKVYLVIFVVRHY